MYSQLYKKKLKSVIKISKKNCVLGSLNFKFFKVLKHCERSFFLLLKRSLGREEIRSYNLEGSQVTRVIFCVIVESFPKEILSKYLEDLKQKKILNLFFLAWFAYTVGLKIRKKCKYFKIF